MPDFPVVAPPGQKPIITSIFDFSTDALGQLRLYFEQNPPAIPITSILGFTQFTASSSTVVTSESTTSTSYTDLTTTGPEVTGLSDGQYIVFFGANSSNNTAGASALVSVSINGAAASDNDFAGMAGTDQMSVCKAVPKTLSAGGNNSVRLKYRAGSNTASFARRWLVVLRYGNA